MIGSEEPAPKPRAIGPTGTGQSAIGFAHRFIFAEEFHAGHDDARERGERKEEGGRGTDPPVPLAPEDRS